MDYNGSMSLTSAAVAAGATIVDECQGWHPGKWSNLVIEGDWGHLGNRVIEGCSVGRGHNNLRGGDSGLGQGFGSSAWDDLDDLLFHLIGVMARASRQLSPAFSASFAISSFLAAFLQ